MLVITPLALAFARPQPLLERRGASEALLMTFLALGSAAVAFGGILPIAWSLAPIALLPFPFLVWAALRFGMRGATATAAIVAAAAVLGTLASTNPIRSGNVHADVASLWMLLATMSVSAMLLAASLEERTAEANARREGEDWLAVALSAAEATPFERDLVVDRERSRARGAADDGRGAWRDAGEWRARIDEADRAALDAAIAACARGVNDSWETEYRVTEGGAARWVLERARVIERSADGKPVRAVGLRRDMTAWHVAADDRRALERQLEEGKRLAELGMLAGGIAHDFNNLLTVVRGNVEVARVESTRASRAAVDAIDEAATRASDLTEQLLAYAGKRPMRKRAIDLAALAQETARMLGASIPTNVTVLCEPDADAPAAAADPAQMRQIAMNLIMNAAQAIGEAKAGTVRVSVGRTSLDGEPAAVRLEVTDDGAGMDQETRARIFEPFFTTKSRGRGLGMAAVLGIVRAHRGRIAVTSEVGVGTTITVDLPASETPAVAAEAPAPPPLDGAHERRRALVVDDEVAIRTLAARVLRDEGYEVVLAASAADARSQLDAASSFDVAILDMSMPDGSGADVMRALRSRAPDLPIVLMSGYSEELLGSDALEGAGFLQKPFRLGDLFASIDGAIASRAASHRDGSHAESSFPPNG